METPMYGELNAGLHQVTFDASKLMSGIYFYRLNAENISAAGKLLFIK
jgi:hypothetical protein